MGWLQNIGGGAAWTCQLGCYRELRGPGWGKEVGLSQPSRMRDLKSRLSGFSTIQRKQRGARSLVGRRAEAHTPEGPVGHLSARAFLASCGEFVPVPRCNPGFCERGFLRPGHHAEFRVRPKNKCRNSTVYERLCKRAVVSWVHLIIFIPTQPISLGHPLQIMRCLSSTSIR